MHPIERLRLVARSGDDDGSFLAREAAIALASLSADPAALVMACRRLVQRQPASGPLWWSCARVLSAADPAEEAYAAADELAEDPTADVLSELLAGNARVEIVEWTGLMAQLARRRPDLQVVVTDPFVRGRRVDVVLVEAMAAGEAGVVAAAGSRQASVLARARGVVVWGVAGVGSVLPPSLFQAAVAFLDDRGRPSNFDVLPSDAFDQVVGPDGPEIFAEAMSRPTCPAVPELTRRAPAPGSAAG
jgi:hypothetical protein